MDLPQKQAYSAGLKFIVTTPSRALGKRNRKSIRSHATKAGVADKETVHLRTWVSGHKIACIFTRSSASVVPSPRQVGAIFSGIQLPGGIEPYMIQDLVKLIELNQHGVYPYELCFNVHVVDRGWFPYMINDPCCLHSMMFSVRAFLDSTSYDRLSGVAYYHHIQTLQLLQARLYEFDHTSAISDATIMVVITLASIAELTGDLATMTNHINGLKKIVSLRGGLRALTTHNNMQVKVCRADLAYTMLSGNPPLLLENEISWKSFVADRGLFGCTHEPHDNEIRVFGNLSLDSKLYNILRDLHTFSCMSNFAYETTRKLSPESYNEIMISILYRLTHLSFDGDPMQEAVRTGLLIYSSAMYMQRDFVKHTYEQINTQYSLAMLRLRETTPSGMPMAILFWLTMLLHLTTHEKHSVDGWQSLWPNEFVLRAGTKSWLEGIIVHAGIHSWEQARQILRSVVWVGFIHDVRGKQAFEEAQLRNRNFEDCNTYTVRTL